MNGLDILLMSLSLTIFIGGFATLVSTCKDEAVPIGILLFLVGLFFSALPISFFFVNDRGSGSSVGEITSVDKNYFGTTAVYIKTSETTQEEYCVEDEEIAKLAKELIGQKVKISYGTRIGLYSTGRCSQAPIENIEKVN